MTESVEGSISFFNKEKLNIVLWLKVLPFAQDTY